MQNKGQQAAIRLAEIDEVEVSVDKLVDGGDGLARFEGIPIFVPRSAPGDRLRVRVVERKPGYGRAEIVEILDAGEGRREPPCPHFERCGGCDLQHLDEGTQLKAKAEAVRETLRRVGGVERLPKVTVIPGQPWGYRLRAQLHVEDSADRGTQVGYFGRGTHDLEPVEQCRVLVPELEAALSPLRERLGDVPHRRVDLTAGDESQVDGVTAGRGLAQGRGRDPGR